MRACIASSYVSIPVLRFFTVLVLHRTAEVKDYIVLGVPAETDPEGMMSFCRTNEDEQCVCDSTELVHRCDTDPGMLKVFTKVPYEVEKKNEEIQMVFRN